ncbi:hypothetical protein [Acidithiobacillus thiooxidans]|uniref:Hemoglobin-like protein n=1 Tax=Acidithiobacillus thiooxidans ATCC 19377 TaxID=637390 RepID=A0A5P9XPW9_ACITH|nr:hypothetical protein [Acidithiobacillus thiooxidans]QFX95740.1 hemoglobin-like protein [Acidithiobacillus thiooxidans ATCC 19377]
MILEPETSPYILLGGESAIRALVNRFYDLMDSEAQWRSPLREMHPADLSESKEKLLALRQIEWVGFTMQRSSCVPNRS